MIMDPNQLEDADRRGVNPYAPENQRAWGQTVAQATGQLNPTEQADTSSSPLAEPEPGTVVGFTKHFREDGPGYAYVAIRVKGKGWFLTGSAAGATTWDDLLEFADGVQLWVTRDWTRLA